jgi:RNA polymerase sigma-70 factor (ECF subfamily)
METKDKANTHEWILVSAAASGDLEAFNDLVLRFQDLVYSVTRSILGDRDAAEDATQETFISAFEHLGGFRGGSFRSWLLRIAKNTCYDFLRTRKRRPTVALFPEDGDGGEIDTPPWIVDPRPSAEAEMERDEFSQIVYRRVDELPTSFRTVITLIDLNGIDYAEAAQALGMPIGTIKSRLARARLRIKESLSQDLQPASEFRTINAQAQALWE